MIERNDSFVNREEELAFIDGLIGDWGTRRVLLVGGPTGIGKTRLLQEVEERYRGQEEPALQVTPVVSLDDRSLHMSESLGRYMANLLDAQVFADYLRNLMDWRRMEKAGISPERLTQEGESVDTAFVKCFNTLTAHKRVVLLLDTIEAMTSTEAWQYVLGLGLQVKNALVILAGRNAEAEWERIQPRVGEDGHFIELEALEPQASEKYLLEKQKQLHITLDPELRRKILLLARGRPILINLAVEWLARDVPLPWIMEMSLSQLEALANSELDERREEFEYHLVRHIGERRQPMDRLLLAMSRVYPLDARMIADILRLSRQQAHQLFEEAASFVFVKSLPGNQITLHDNFQDILMESLWPRIDPDGEERREDSRLAITALDRKIASLQERIRALGEEEEVAGQAQDADRELDLFLERETLEREYWVLSGRKLEHLLNVDLDQGIDMFVEIFDEATEEYRFSFRETVLSQVQNYADRLSAAQRYEVDNRRVRYWLDHGQYEYARDIALGVLQREDLSVAQETDMLILLGNLEIRLGKLGDGVDRFEQAVEISQGLQDWQLRAQNALGWGYRLTGRLDEAARIYREAHGLSVALGDRRRQAWLLNNWAFVLARKGNVSSALAMCKDAEAMWHELDFERGLGAVYEVYGEAYSRAEKLAEALRYYQKALDIFEPQGDKEWLARVYTERGRTHWLLGDYDQAQKDLQRGLDLETGLNKPMTLHYLGHLYESKGDLERAKQFFQECYEVSRQAPDYYFELNALGDQVRLSADEGDYERLEEFEESYQVYRRERARHQGEPDASLPRYDGLLLKYLGDLALGSTPDDVSKAARYYAQGLPYIARYESYAPFKLSAQVDRTNRLLTALSIPSEQIAYLGEHLLRTWNEKELNAEYAEVLVFFDVWKTGRVRKERVQ